MINFCWMRSMIINDVPAGLVQIAIALAVDTCAQVDSPYASWTPRGG